MMFPGLPPFTSFTLLSPVTALTLYGIDQLSVIISYMPFLMLELAALLGPDLQLVS